MAFHLGLAGLIATLAALFAQRFEVSYPTFVTGATGFNTLTDPNLFLR